MYGKINKAISGTGTVGNLPKFLTTTSVGDSIISESSGTITVTGNESVTGTLGITGDTTLSSATNAASISTGGLRTLGGVGITKDLWVGGITNIASTVTMQAGANVGGNLFVSGSSTLSGTSFMTGTATFTVSPILSALSASLPVFTDGAKALVSNTMTGTGSVVMSASPTLTGTASFANTTNSGTLDVAGNAGVGGTAGGTIGFRVLSTALTGVDQYGVVSLPTFNSAATGNGNAFYGKVITSASAFTMANGITMYIDAALKGAGSTITNLYGLKIENQTAGTNNWAIKTGLGLVQFGENVLVGGTLGVTGATTHSAPVAVNADDGLDIRGATSGGVIAYFGNATSVNATYPGYIYISATNTINAGYNVNNDTAALYFNYRGYQNSNTKFRNFVVADGKNIDILNITGSTKLAAFSGAVTIASTLAVTGNTTVTATSFLRGSGYSAITGANSDRGMAIVGTSNGQQLQFDHSNIQGMNNLSPQSISLNNYGGGVSIASTGAATAIKGTVEFYGDPVTHSGGGYEYNSYTATMTGTTGPITKTIYYLRWGRLVTIMIPYDLQGTSTTNSGTITGMPSVIFPTQKTDFPCAMLDNNLSYPMSAGNGFFITADGVMHMVFSGSEVATAANTKGFDIRLSNTSSNVHYQPFQYLIQ